jgi:hypothetical protein
VRICPTTFRRRGRRVGIRGRVRILASCIHKLVSNVM